MDSATKYLNHFAVIFQIFGLQLFSVKSLSATNLTSLPSLAYTIYFVFILVTFTGQMGIFAYFTSGAQEPLSTKTVLNNGFQRSLYAGLIVIIFISLIKSYVSTPLIKMFYFNCIKISKMSSGFYNPIDNRQINRNVFNNFLLTIFISKFLVYLYEIYFDQNQVHLKTFGSIFHLLFLNVTALKFVFYVKLINLYLEAVAKFLTEISKPCVTVEANMNFNVKTGMPRLPLDTSCKIRKLVQIYNLIFENAGLINQSMGATVLAIFSVMVLVITSSGYRVFLTIVGKFPVAAVGGKI